MTNTFTINHHPDKIIEIV